MTNAWWLHIRKSEPVQWDIAWLWIGLILCGVTELIFAAYGFYKAFEVFLEKVGLGG